MAGAHVDERRGCGQGDGRLPRHAVEERGHRLAAHRQARPVRAVLEAPGDALAGGPGDVVEEGVRRRHVREARHRIVGRRLHRPGVAPRTLGPLLPELVERQRLPAVRVPAKVEAGIVPERAEHRERIVAVRVFEAPRHAVVGDVLTVIGLVEPAG
ncbi:hypothetical protein B7486_70750, partial [cyanobacterium TDX16]